MTVSGFGRRGCWIKPVGWRHSSIVVEMVLSRSKENVRKWMRFKKMGGKYVNVLWHESAAHRCPEAVNAPWDGHCSTKQITARSPLDSSPFIPNSKVFMQINKMVSSYTLGNILWSPKNRFSQKKMIWGKKVHFSPFQEDLWNAIENEVCRTYSWLRSSSR